MTRTHRSRVVSASRRAAATVAAWVTLAAAPGPVRADAWTPVLFIGPNGKSAQGFATDAVDAPGARLLVGCETGPDAWHGVALLERAPLPVPTPPADGFTTEIVTAFFGRAPVTARWRSRVTDDGLLSWLASGEELRRGLLREDSTRGRATLTIDVRRGAAAQRLVFGVGGIGSHGPELAALCDGWRGTGTSKRRERGW